MAIHEDERVAGARKVSSKIARVSRFGPWTEPEGMVVKRRDSLDRKIRIICANH